MTLMSGAPPGCVGGSVGGGVAGCGVAVAGRGAAGWAAAGAAWRAESAALERPAMPSIAIQIPTSLVMPASSPLLLSGRRVGEAFDLLAIFRVGGLGAAARRCRRDIVGHQVGVLAGQE